MGLGIMIEIKDLSRHQSALAIPERTVKINILFHSSTQNYTKKDAIFKPHRCTSGQKKTDKKQLVVKQRSEINENTWKVQ